MNLSRQDREKLSLEKDKINLEKSKLSLEKDKIALERDKLRVTVLIEDFKARWQELLNFETENNRWSTLYVTALILVISWVINNNNYTSLKDLFSQKENSYFIISLALINAIYTLAMALKGYQIQQIALYQYTVIGQKIATLTGQPFNIWEKWRREDFHSDKLKGSPELIRFVYYPIIGMLPTAVSTTILVLYFVNEWHRHRWNGGHNIYFYIVSTMVLASFLTALSTTLINRKWKRALSNS